MLEDTSQTQNTETGSSGGEFSIGEFLNDAKAAPPADVPQLEEDSKDGDAPEDDGTAVQPPQPKRTIQEIQAHRSQVARSRKFDGLDEAETNLFKNMSQEAYDRLYPHYLESKGYPEKLKALENDLKAASERRWYEEPGAYKLHPDFAQASQTASYLDGELEFWQEQLAAVEEGKPWYLLTFNEDGKGNRDYQYGEKQEPSAAAKAKILSNISQCQQYKSQIGTKLAGLKSTFVSKYKTFNDALTAADKAMFGTLDLEKAGIKSVVDEWLNKIPAEFRGQLPYQMLAKSNAVILGLVSRLREMEAATTRKAAVQSSVIQSGPGRGQVGNSGGKTTEDYDKAFSAMTRRKL